MDPRTANCGCTLELNILKDSVSTLEANMLLLRQTMQAKDKIVNDQLVQFKSAIFDLKHGVLNCTRSIAEILNSTVTTMRSISSSAMEYIIQIEDRIRVLEATLDVQGGSGCCDVDLEPVDICGDTVSYTNNVDSRKSGDLSTGVTPIDICCPSIDVESSDTVRQSNLSSFLVHKTNVSPSVDSQSKGAQIPVRLTYRDNKHSYRDVSTDGFTVQTRRRTKRVCILGLSHNVNTIALTNDVQSKGPKITNIRVFPCKRNPSKVVICMNLVADENYERVLDCDFWPPYVTCKPWLSRSRRQPVNSSNQRDYPPRSQSHSTWEVPPRMRRRDSYDGENITRSTENVSTMLRENRYFGLTEIAD
ncbi:hypothetical protein ACF0H5_016877 [Mactra antiquata]